MKLRVTVHYLPILLNPDVRFMKMTVLCAFATLLDQIPLVGVIPLPICATLPPCQVDGEKIVYKPTYSGLRCCWLKAQKQLTYVLPQPLKF